ncbi:MAG: alpha/beta fold hydrolase [Rhodospirillales bacterium]|nr:alpha/beta fold hydrolase [Rhodospirillales bacterium]
MSDAPFNFLITGPDDAEVTLVLAHGAGALMDSPFMEKFANGLGEKGVRVVRFEFPYMVKRREDGKKRPPDRGPVLMEIWRAVIAELGGPDKLFIGGKSMGGRIASMVAAELDKEETPVRGVACLGYPFHPPGKPTRLRTDHFHHIKTPVLIVQGARDTMGWFDEVQDYTLSKAVQFHWAEDGDHDLKPRALSGKTMKENHEEAIDVLAEFLLSSGEKV